MNGVLLVQICSRANFSQGLKIFIATGPIPLRCLVTVYPFPKRQILDSSNLEEFADGNFKFVENGREFSCRVENTVEKGEIARYKQFLLFPLCFQKTCTADT